MRGRFTPDWRNWSRSLGFHSAGASATPPSPRLSVTCACRNGRAPRRRQVRRLELSPGCRQAVYMKNSAFANAIRWTCLSTSLTAAPAGHRGVSVRRNGVEKGAFHFFSASRGRARGRKAASRPKRAAARRARAAHGGSGRARCATKVLPRHTRYNRKSSTSYIAANASRRSWGGRR
jgi:hypothetical protein